MFNKIEKYIKCIRDRRMWLQDDIWKHIMSLKKGDAITI